MKTVKYLTFNNKQEPELIAAINQIAQATDRKPHDAVKRLILDAASKLQDTSTLAAGQRN